MSGDPTPGASRATAAAADDASAPPAPIPGAGDDVSPAPTSTSREDGVPDTATDAPVPGNDPAHNVEDAPNPGNAPAHNPEGATSLHDDDGSAHAATDDVAGHGGDGSAHAATDDVAGHGGDGSARVAEGGFRRGGGSAAASGTAAAHAARIGAGGADSASVTASAPPVARSWRYTFSSLKIPNYRLYFTGQSISLVGTWMQMTAQAWLVLTLTHSATALGLVTALQTLPVLVLGPYGGVIADRSDKLKLMTILQAFMGVQALVLGLLTVFHAVHFWEICLLAMFLGVNNAFENSPRQSFIREMVGMDQLRNAITLNSVTVNAARAVGPGIGGILIATVGVGVCFLLNAASFVAVVVSLMLMNRSQLRPSPPTPRAKGQLREGFEYALRTRNIIVPLAMMGLVGLLAYEFQVSLPVLAQRTFHGGSEVYGFITASMGVGAVVGGLFTAARGRTGIRAMVIASTGFGCAIMVCAYAPNLAVVYIAMLFAGWASVSFISIGNSTIQLAARPEMRGRVISLWQVAFQGTTPIGGPLVGWIIAASDPRTGLAVGGVACLVAAVAGILYTRPRTKADDAPRAVRLSGFGADQDQDRRRQPERKEARSVSNRAGS